MKVQLSASLKLLGVFNFSVDFFLRSKLSSVGYDKFDKAKAKLQEKMTKLQNLVHFIGLFVNGKIQIFQMFL